MWKRSGHKGKYNNGSKQITRKTKNRNGQKKWERRIVIKINIRIKWNRTENVKIIRKWRFRLNWK